MNFEKNKKQFLSKPDKSFIGGIDKPILPLVKLLNSKSDYYTTSSCAGRILLIKDTNQKLKKAFVFVTHGKVSFNKVLKELKNVKDKELIYFKHDPCILHVACKDFDSALKLVSIARDLGWKKSGVISKKNIVELVSTEVLAAPIMFNKKVLVSEDYLKVLVSEANKKLFRTRKKISDLMIKSKLPGNK